MIRKFIFLLIVLIFTSPLFSGWHWQEIQVPSPPVVARMSYQIPTNFRAGYDPATDSIIVNFITPDLEHQSWSYDGTTWNYVSDCLKVRYGDRGKILFGTTYQTLYDFTATTGHQGSIFTRIGRWTGETWEELNHVQYMLDVTYNVSNQEFALLYYDWNLPDYTPIPYILFFDGDNLETIRLTNDTNRDHFYPFIEYDPGNNSYLMISSGVQYDWDDGPIESITWSYSDGILELIEAPFYIDHVPICRGRRVLALNYSPLQEGIIVLFEQGCTLLWKDLNWTILREGNNEYFGSIYQKPQMIYFPPMQTTLLLLVDETTGEIKIYSLQNRKHGRPFDK